MTPEEDATDDQDAQQSMTELQDWDEEPLENTAKHPFRWKFIVLILVLAVVAVVCTGFGISYSHYHSAEYQIKSARVCSFQGNTIRRLPVMNVRWKSIRGTSP